MQALVIFFGSLQALDFKNQRKKVVCKKFGLVKDKYHGYTYEGNETTKIFKSTRSLKRMVKRSEKTNSVIKSLIAFKSFYKKCCGTLPKTGWQLSVEFVRRNLLDIHAVHSVSLTNKVHILFSHVFEYINLTGKGLGRVSDQIVEACHSALNKRLVASKYWIQYIDLI